MSSSTQPAAPARSLQCPGPFKSIRLVARQQCGPRWSCTAEALPRASLARSRWLALNKGLPPVGGGRFRGRVDRALQTAPALPGMSVEGTSRAPLARPSLPPTRPARRQKTKEVPAAGFFALLRAQAGASACLGKKETGRGKRDCGRRSEVKPVHSPASYRIGTGKVKSVTCNGGSSNISFLVTFFSHRSKDGRSFS